jgi:hypothetical protein
MVVLSSRELFWTTKPVYFRCLLLLSVQHHIELPWRTLPEAFQGDGLPNFALLSLASKLQLIQCIWGFHDAAFKSLAMGYKFFMMKLSFYGNNFGYNYRQFSGLASDGTWFNNIWELLHDFLELQHHSIWNSTCTQFKLAMLLL